jgi:succinate dehydrogenase/fumarate reductase flavoprotein subunit
LASNSLLEGLVYGARAAQAMAKEASPAASKEAVKAEEAASPKTSEAEIQPVVCGGVTGTRAASGEDVTALRHKARELMETHVGMVRTAEGLAEAITRLEVIHRQLLWHEDRLRPDALEIETRNIMECGLAIARSALERRESRGSHWRSDYPATDDAHFRRHSLLDADKARLE